MNPQLEKKVSENSYQTPENSTETPKEHAEFKDFQIPQAVSERYTYVRSLGKGSQGQVWLARRHSDNVQVAIKQLSIQSLKTWKQYELFNREAKTLACLDIDGVVPFYEYIESLDEDPMCVCIVQKYIAGQTLASMLKAKHRFKAEAIYDMVSQILKILEKLHGHQPPIIHRDIKPSNLMLTPTGNGFYRVTLIDFGAVANPHLKVGSSTVTGTYGYMPPEQMMGQSHPASDIYALGAVAVELLSGMSPAEIEICDFKLVIEPHLMHLPEDVVHTLNLMLEPAIENRICDYRTLIDQFDAYCSKRQTSWLSILRRTAIPKLEDVESIGQLGNYEIWQNLDQTKAADIEKCPHHLEGVGKFSDLDRRLQIVLVSIFAMLAMILFSICLNFVSGANFLLNTAIFTALSLAIAKGFSLSKKALQKRITTSNILDKSPFQNVSKEDYIRLQKVLTDGQKFVGKILTIEYVSVQEKYSILQRTQGFKAQILTSDLPKFRILYKFQYVSEYTAGLIDFYGELYAYTLPEGRYAVGDPITLIADITYKTESTFLLSVIPYPYPFGDILNIEDVLYTCEIDNSYLSTGKIKDDKQLALYCLAHFESCDDADILKAADGSTDNAHDALITKRLYELLAQRYLSRLDANDNENEEDKVYYNEQDAYNNMNFRQFNMFYAQLGEQFLYRHDVEKNEGMLKVVEFYIHKLHDKEKIDLFYEQLAQQCLLRFEENGNTHLLLKAGEIYRDKRQNLQKAKTIFRLLAQRYMTRFHTFKDIDALSKAGDIYRWELNDKIMSESCYFQLVHHQIAQFNICKDEKLLSRAAEISQWDLKDEVLAANCYHRLALHHLQGFNETNDETCLLKAIDIYRNKLQDAERTKKACGYLARYYALQYETENNEECLIKAAEIYDLELDDKENYKKYYRILVNHYIAKFNACKNDKILLRAADICQWKLNDKSAAKACYECLVQSYDLMFERGDDEAMFKAAEIYHDYFLDPKALQICFDKLKTRYTQRIQASQDDPKAKNVKDYCDQIAKMLESHTKTHQTSDEFKSA